MNGIYFDMDGTLCDLYSEPHWLRHLRRENPSPYIKAKPLWNKKQLKFLLDRLVANNWEIQIITWLSRGSSPVFDDKVRSAKNEWLRRNFPIRPTMYKKHIIKNGVDKIQFAKVDGAKILIDDNAAVRKKWEEQGGIALLPDFNSVVNYIKEFHQDFKWE